MVTKLELCRKYSALDVEKNLSIGLSLDAFLYLLLVFDIISSWIQETNELFLSSHSNHHSQYHWTDLHQSIYTKQSPTGSIDFKQQDETLLWMLYTLKHIIWTCFFLVDLCSSCFHSFVLSRVCSSSEMSNMCACVKRNKKQAKMEWIVSIYRGERIETTLICRSTKWVIIFIKTETKKIKQFHHVREKESDKQRRHFRTKRMNAHIDVYIYMCVCVRASKSNWHVFSVLWVDHAQWRQILLKCDEFNDQITW